MEMHQNGLMSGLEMADELYGQRAPRDVAVPATTMHQVFRGQVFKEGEEWCRGEDQ